MVADVLQPLGRDPTSARDVLEKGPDLVGFRRPAEGDEENCVRHCNECREPGVSRGWRALGATRLRCNECREPGVSRGWRALGATRLRTAITWRTSRGPVRRAPSRDRAPG